MARADRWIASTQSGGAFRYSEGGDENEVVARGLTFEEGTPESPLEDPGDTETISFEASTEQ